jgi:hypothetical protein
MNLVMECFDLLPADLRYWVSNLHFSLHDDHILRGTKEVRKCKNDIEAGGKVIFLPSNGQN